MWKPTQVNRILKNQVYIGNVVRNVVIGKDVFLAAGVCVAQDLHIGDGAYLGIGAVVLKNVNPGDTVFGNPARVMPKVK